MKLTLGEVSQTESFAGLELIAGKEGLSRTLSTCALLDYEFVLKTSTSIQIFTKTNW